MLCCPAYTIHILYEFHLYQLVFAIDNNMLINFRDLNYLIKLMYNLSMQNASYCSYYYISPIISVLLSGAIIYLASL